MAPDEQRRVSDSILHEEDGVRINSEREDVDDRCGHMRWGGGGKKAEGRTIVPRHAWDSHGGRSDRANGRSISSFQQQIIISVRALTATKRLTCRTSGPRML